MGKLVVMEANWNRISELRRRQELLGDLLLVDHGIYASPRLCASHFFINDQFYQWNSVAAVVDTPVSLDWAHCGEFPTWPLLSVAAVGSCSGIIFSSAVWLFPTRSCRPWAPVVLCNQLHAVSRLLLRCDHHCGNTLKRVHQAWSIFWHLPRRLLPVMVPRRHHQDDLLCILLPCEHPKYAAIGFSRSIGSPQELRSNAL